MIDPGRRAAHRPAPRGRTDGGAGHVFTLYVAAQEPAPRPEGDRDHPSEPSSLGFLHTTDEGPSGP